MTDERRSRTGAEATGTYSQWRLLWRRFRRHRIGVVGGVAVLLAAIAATFGEFIAPHDVTARHARYTYVPPQPVHVFSAEGFHLRPFIYEVTRYVDPKTGLPRYYADTSKRHPVYLFVRGDRYSVYGLFESDLHLFGTRSGHPWFPLGTDRFGRDLFSRLVVGARMSLLVSLLAVVLSVALGTALGLISGYYGGATDTIVQRLVELVQSFPQIPLLMALSALIPPDWPVYFTFLGLVIVLALVGWGRLAREIRGKTLAIRDADFVLAARVYGATDTRIIFRHVLPSMVSHVIVIATLTIPIFILSESTLSFLGLGLKPPLVSWGILLSDAMNIYVVALYPWLLLPGVCIIVIVLAFNLFGDGLRDAAVPFAR